MAYLDLLSLFLALACSFIILLKLFLSFDLLFAAHAPVSLYTSVSPPVPIPVEVVVLFAFVRTCCEELLPFNMYLSGCCCPPL